MSNPKNNFKILVICIALACLLYSTDPFSGEHYCFKPLFFIASIFI